MTDGRSLGFYVLAAFFALFVVFMYGPMMSIMILAFQGPDGGLTFPMNGVSLHWFANLFQEQAVGDFAGAWKRSIMLAFMVMIANVVIAVSAGMAYRRRFIGAGPIFTLTVASLIVPSILVSLGIGLMFDRLDWEPNWYSSAYGAHLTWTLPFGLLIMFAVFNRFDKSYEEAARDMGATPWQSFSQVVLPIILPSVIGVALFGFTLSYDEFARTLQASGSTNTLPLEIFGMTTNVTTPVLYALGALTTGLSFLVIGLSVVGALIVQSRRARLGNDAGKGV